MSACHRSASRLFQFRTCSCKTPVQTSRWKKRGKKGKIKQNAG